MSRRIVRIMLIGYSAAALMLTAGVAVHLALRTPAIAKAPLEVATQPEAPAFRRE